MSKVKLEFLDFDAAPIKPRHGEIIGRVWTDERTCTFFRWTLEEAEQALADLNEAILRAGQ